MDSVLKRVLRLRSRALDSRQRELGEARELRERSHAAVTETTDAMARARASEAESCSELLEQQLYCLRSEMVRRGQEVTLARADGFVEKATTSVQSAARAKGSIERIWEARVERDAADEARRDERDLSDLAMSKWRSK